VKVALVSPYALSVFGGVQEQVLGMSRSLSARGHEVLVVAPNNEDRASYDTPARVLRVGEMTSVPANGSRAPLALSKSASAEVARALAEFHPGVVHLHEPFAPRFGWETLRTHSFPAVGTFHRSGVSTVMRLASPYLRRMARQLDASVAVSDEAARTANLTYKIEPIVLFNGFELERFRTPARVVPSEPTLISIGRLEERKGASVAIEAVLAHNERPGVTPWRLLVVGSGPQEDALRTRYRDPAISFRGSVSDEEKRRLLRQSSVSISPALRGESFGLVLLEAMAAEIPVVASDIAGYAAAAQQHAHLFVPGDAADLERAVAQALLATEGFLTAASEHAQTWSMAKLVEEYESIYESVQRGFSSR